MNVKTCFLVMAVLGLMNVQAPTWAHSPNDTGGEGLQAKVREAGLIMYGQVIDIQYRNSEPTKEQPQGLPHTFVTYRVLEVLRGDVPDKIITLRIPGGADGQGGVYMVTTAPAFARGQTDVLFVKGGEIGDCHLVDCVEGRFRVHDNQVFNGWGVPVVEAHKILRIGGRPRFDLNVMELPRPSFKALLERPGMREHLYRLSQENGETLDELQKRYDREAPKMTTVNLGNQMAPISKDLVEEPEAEPMETYSAPLTPEVFFEAIREWSRHFGNPQGTFTTANIKERFMVADPEVMPVETIRELEPKISDEERYDVHAKEGRR